MRNGGESINTIQDHGYVEEGLTIREYFIANHPVKFEDLHMDDLTQLKDFCKELDFEFPKEEDSYLNILKLKIKIEAALSVMKADALIEALNK